MATGVDLASNRNYYQEYFLGGKCGRCVGLTTLTPSCTHCLENWELQLSETLRAWSGLLWECFTFTFTYVFKSLIVLGSQQLFIPSTTFYTSLL
jgi:hypothetical protein